MQFRMIFDLTAYNTVRPKKSKMTGTRNLNNNNINNHNNNNSSEQRPPRIRCQQKNRTRSVPTRIQYRSGEGG